MARFTRSTLLSDLLYRFAVAVSTILTLAALPATEASASQPQPLQVSFGEEQIGRLKSRVKEARLPAAMPEESWDNGPTRQYMLDLQAYWVQQYDWQATEQRINAFDNFTAEIEGERLHYLVETGSGENPVPIILIHGWPHNFLSFLDVIDPLAHPEKFGGKTDQAYTVVVVSLPGSGFSDKPATPLGPKAMARRLHTLMHSVLGFDKYAVHGGDWGALIGSWMAFEQPEAVSMLHLNHALLRPHGVWLGSGNSDALPDASALEVAFLQAESAAFASPTATYFALQSARPQSVSYAFADSPMGAAAWYADKYAQWVDTATRPFETVMNKHVLLDQVMLTLLTESVDSAMWIYNGAARELPWTLEQGQSITVPTVFAAFPDPFIMPPPKALVARSYALHDWHSMEEGGHWPMLERPDLFIQSLRTAASIAK